MSNKKPGAKPGSEGSRRISEAHRGPHEHDKRGGFAVSNLRAREAGKKGIQTVREKYGTEVFRERGRRGGNVTKDRFGSSYFSELGRRGAEARKRKRK